MEQFQAWVYNPADKTYTADKPQTRVLKLPGGLYNLYRNHYGYPVAQKLDIRADEICADSLSAFEILGEIGKFWQGKADYDHLRISHKRGVLLYGPAGCGKSIIVQRAIAGVVELGGFAVRPTKHSLGTLIPLLSEMQQVQEKSPVLVVMEDAENIIEEGEEEVLEALDGATGFHGSILFLLTTNHVQSIPERIKSRPSRIDTCVWIGPPTLADRETYVRFLNGDAMETRAIAKATEGLSYAEVKEVVVGMTVYSRSLAEAVQAIRREFKEDEE